MNATEARKDLFRLIDAVADSHVPVVITGRRHNAVLVNADDWRAIQETLHLAQIPGMVASIREGLDTPPEAMDERLDW
jgi:antitoxin YefM